MYCFSNTDICHETRIMLKLPKGLKKKKKGKKSKRKGEEELFTEAELEKYRREHQQQAEAGEGSVKNEEWSKFKDLTTGVDSVLKKTQGDLDRIKSTSFFQRVPAGPKSVDPVPKAKPHRPVVEITEADFPQLVQAAAEAGDADKSDYGLTDDESEEDDQDDIFDTSYVDAVERGEVKLAYVPDSPDDFQDDDIFDTSHVDALIKGQDAKASKGKKGLDIGIAVEVLTGRIDNLTVTAKRSSKRTIPGDLLLEDTNTDFHLPLTAIAEPEPVEKSILDLDSDIPITTPIDLSISLHTSLVQQNVKPHQKQEAGAHFDFAKVSDDEIDEFTLLATESLEVSGEATKLDQKEIKLEPVVQESWSAFEADKNVSVFAECIVEDQIDVIDPYIDGDDPFDTSFADAVIPSLQSKEVIKEAVILEDDDDDDFDPRAEEVRFKLNNRRKSSVRIHLTDPSGIRESITSDDIADHSKNQEQTALDLLGGSTTDLSQLSDSPLNPIDINTDTDFDPFDTSIVDKIVAPGKVELKFLEQELIGASPAPAPVYRVPSDDDFDPRAEEPKPVERRPSRPENLVVSKSVVFDVSENSLEADPKNKNNKPLTPYYTREVSITEDLNEEAEAADSVAKTLTRVHSDEDLAPKLNLTKRRHSEYPQTKQTKVKASDLLHSGQTEIQAKVLTPTGPQLPIKGPEIDPFDTTFANNIKPGRTELKLLAKEFSCEETSEPKGEPDLLEPSNDLFQVRALTPQLLQEDDAALEEDFDPFDTSFASDLNPGRTELKLLESEFLGH